MRRLLIGLGIVLVAATSVQAQTLSARPGDWLVWDFTIALRRGQVCQSPWFDPRPTQTEPVTCWILSIGAADGLVCQSATTYWEIPIQVPAC